MTLDITSADRARLKRQLNGALKLDPDLQSVINQVGYPAPRKRNADFATLLQIIVSQQLSTTAAVAIGSRLHQACNGDITWRKILNRNAQQLRDCGLSWRKVEYAKDLAAMIRNKDINLQKLPSMQTEQVIQALIKIRGFGRWSAEIFAMFALARQDVYPADDLALQIALQRYLRLQQRPGAKQTAELATRWSPYRSSVALLMWKYYGAALD